MTTIGTKRTKTLQKDENEGARGLSGRRKEEKESTQPDASKKRQGDTR